MLSEKTDEELMIAYQLGEVEAFDLLYSRHAPRVLGFLRKKLRSEPLALDIFQATFLKLHRARARYDASFPFVPWLFTICRNELLDALKKSSFKHEVLVAEVPEHSLTEEPEVPTVDLSRLPVLQKQALELRYGEEFSFDEIADRLDTSPENARQLVSRAIRALRDFYGKK